MSDVLKTLLSTIEATVEPMTEWDIRKKILDVRDDYIAENTEDQTPFDAEDMAFDFYETRNGESCWGTYFGPAYAGEGNDGKRVEIPSLKSVTGQTIDYWKGRAVESTHPLCKLRYAGLVWDLCKVSTGEKPPVEMAHMVIDEAIKVADGVLHRHSSSIVQKLGKALRLAISIKDDNRSDSVQDAIIRYEDAVAEDKMLGLWGFAYDLLVDEKKVDLSKPKCDKIIKDLEDRLARVSDDSVEFQLDPHAAESAALKLARHYRRHSSNEDMERVLVSFANAFLKASKNAAAIQASGWLQRVHAVLLQFNLRGHAEQVAVKLREYAEKSSDEMKGIPVDMEITKEEMDKFLEGLTSGSRNVAIERIAVHFIPRKEEIKNQVLELAKTAAFTFAIGKTIVDHAGRPVAHVGGIDSDLDGNVVHMMSQNMQYSAIFLNLAIKKGAEKFELNSEQWLEFILASPIFDAGKTQMIRRGVKAYCESDWPVAIHLLIPQIEDALRNLVKLLGNSTFKLGRNGAMMLKNFDELLRVEMIAKTFGDDIVHYLRGLFSDQRCWNLRNRVCHGIIPDASLNESVADRVFHVLLVLALVKASSPKPKKVGQTTEQIT